MKPLSIQLFGQFSIGVQDQILTSLGSARIEELFCFLLIQGGPVFRRESLAAQFWGDTTTKQSRKNLRACAVEASVRIGVNYQGWK